MHRHREGAEEEGPSGEQTGAARRGAGQGRGGDEGQEQARADGDERREHGPQQAAAQEHAAVP